MRVLRIVSLFGLIGLFFVGCTASGAGSRPGEALTPTSLAMGSIPTPTPTRAGAPPGTPGVLPSPTRSQGADVFRPKPLPGGFSVAPNWLVFQPMRPDGWDLEDRIWLTDGQHWIGPFPFTGNLAVWEEDFFATRRDGTWEACRRSGQSSQCIAPLPGELPGSRKVLEASCQGDIRAATVSCDLPPGMPVPQVRVPNPFQGLKEDGKVWVKVLVWALEGDPTMLVAVTWDKEWGPMEVPSRPDVHLYVLQPGGAPRVLLPQKERKEVMIAVGPFSPDGRFLLIPDFSPEAGEFTTWIVRWPEGDRVNWPGQAIWLKPRPESPGR